MPKITKKELGLTKLLQK